jgi:DNA-binding CsgD family transcriptional regulator
VNEANHTVKTTGLPEPDPAYPIVAAIPRLVPASQWSFARVAPTGDLTALLASNGNRDELTRLARDQIQRQRAKAKAGPRIGATIGPLGEYASGVTLLFADGRTDFGILTLLRTRELGPFTSSEISVLTLALAAVTEFLSELSLPRPPRRAKPGLREIGPAAERGEGAFYVLDRDLRIVLAWNSEDQRPIALTGLETRIAERLPVALEEAVRELTAGWPGAPLKQPGVAHPAPFLAVRTQPMSGPAGMFIGVRIDRAQAPNSLARAAIRFGISPREVQVLALLLDGNPLEQIAKQLLITSSTVQNHLRSMLDKTECCNRSELLARVLGWESTPHAREA